MFGHSGLGSMQFIMPLVDRKGQLFTNSAWGFASLVGMYSVIEGKRLFGNSVLVARFARGHLFGDRA